MPPRSRQPRNSRSVSRSDRHGIVLGPVRPKRAIRSRRWSGTGSRRSLQYRARSSRPIWSCTCRSRGPEAEVIFVRVATIALHSLQGGSARLSQPPAPTIRMPVITLICACGGALASATRPISGSHRRPNVFLPRKGLIFGQRSPRARLPAGDGGKKNRLCPDNQMDTHHVSISKQLNADRRTGPVCRVGSALC